ncbi:uncharacterized protein LOC132700609 [Cylas formicarius]|uniref:uncharacterized protein LOC132700609 n=1 Tax=Cylas formicarius TaxID=197179 RepID=UPI002958AD7D|nr:uncharacterized protein LOC132700609 [Cylas formicarius]
MAPNGLQNRTRQDKLAGIKIYLPPSVSDAGNRSIERHLPRYLENEFPSSTENATVYPIPCQFLKEGERQGCLAEKIVFERLESLKLLTLPGLWVTFFHNASYAGNSTRNDRLGRLMVREHDFVAFVRYQKKFSVILIEVKSTSDGTTVGYDLEKNCDAKILKNNKRSAQHQLRDHLEVLQNSFDGDIVKQIQCYIIWPFLGEYTKDPRQQRIRRWADEPDLHVFENCILNQDNFNCWFLEKVLCGKSCEEGIFLALLNRYIILSCGVFMDELDANMLALLTRQQLKLLNSDICKRGGVLVVHGLAGTGKTLLILKKLQLLHETGQLNDENRALYICYWPGIRCEVMVKLKALGIDKYVDTARIFVTSEEFLKGNSKKYKHVFMDESEAICLAFSADIVHTTLSRIYSCYHAANCKDTRCPYGTLEKNYHINDLVNNHREVESWGELWFLVDTNQAMMFLPKYSPEILKTPHIVLNKIMRSTEQIARLVRLVSPGPHLTETLGFSRIVDKEPPVYWVDRKGRICETVSDVIIDLFATKGVKPQDLCVIPFLQNDLLSRKAINDELTHKFVEKSFKPEATSDVEQFLLTGKPNEFLIAWALRVKGLEFKVVIMAIDEDQYDKTDPEDRRKVYIIASRSTCMLIVISDKETRGDICLESASETYPFNLVL